jgi:hypothetical protein
MLSIHQVITSKKNSSKRFAVLLMNPLVIFTSLEQLQELESDEYARTRKHFFHLVNAYGEETSSIHKRATGFQLSLPG